MSEKAKERKPIGRHITKGNFDEIDGGPDIESVYTCIKDDVEDEDYEDWNDEDFNIQRAQFQFDMRCLDPNAPIIRNLMGTGEEVLNLAMDEEGKCPYEKLGLLFENELRIHPQGEEVMEIKEKEDPLKSLISKTTRNLDMVLNWKFLVPLVVMWQVLAGPIWTFICNFLPFALIKTIYDYLIQSRRPVDTTSAVNSLSQQVLEGKELLMKAFLENQDVLKQECRSEIMQDVMSTASDVTTTSKAYIGVLRKYKTPQPPPSLMSENELTVPVSRGRIYQNVNFNGVLEVNCLIDLGATSSSVNRTVLDMVEKRLGYKLPRLKRTFPVMSFAHDKPQQQECVVMNITTQSTATERVPFLVNDVDSKVQALIGINVIRHWGTDISIGRNKEIIEFKNSVIGKRNIQPSIDKTSSDVVTAKRITIYPMQTTLIPGRISEDLHPNLGNEFLFSLELEDSSIVSTPFLFKRRGDHLDIFAQNIGKSPITLTKGIQIGQIETIQQDIYTQDNTMLELAG